MLQLTVKVGEKVDIEGVAKVHVLEKSGRCVKLGFETDRGPIKIERAPAYPLPLQISK